MSSKAGKLDRRFFWRFNLKTPPAGDTNSRIKLVIGLKILFSGYGMKQGRFFLINVALNLIYAGR